MDENDTLGRFFSLLTRATAFSAASSMWWAVAVSRSLLVVTTRGMEISFKGDSLQTAVEVISELGMLVMVPELSLMEV